MEKICNVSLVGVGGQGILLTSEILARTAMLAGYDVKKSEVHGMAQRGGSVISQVRFGAEVQAPLIADGDSDFVVAFEKTEALRWYPLLRARGRIIVSAQEILPVTVSSGLQPAVAGLDERLRELYGARLTMVDALGLAAAAGNLRTVNLVLAGALAALLPLAPALWHDAMRGRIPAKLIEVNLRAFEAGRAVTQGR